MNGRARVPPDSLQAEQDTPPCRCLWEKICRHPPCCINGPGTYGTWPPGAARREQAIPRGTGAWGCRIRPVPVGGGNGSPFLRYRPPAGVHRAWRQGLSPAASRAGTASGGGEFSGYIRGVKTGFQANGLSGFLTSRQPWCLTRKVSCNLMNYKL